MIEHPNWIEAKAKCNVDRWISTLAEMMRVDVERMNQHIAKCNETGALDIRRFQYEDCGQKGPEPVVKQGLAPNAHGNLGGAVKLTRHGEHLRFLRYESDIDQNPVETNVRIEWNGKENRCELRIGKEVAAPWDVCRRVLEPLFFGLGM